jgi:hypothetical protein
MPPIRSRDGAIAAAIGPAVWIGVAGSGTGWAELFLGVGDAMGPGVVPAHCDATYGAALNGKQQPVIAASTTGVDFGHAAVVLSDCLILQHQPAALVRIAGRRARVVRHPV